MNLSRREIRSGRDPALQSPFSSALSKSRSDRISRVIGPSQVLPNERVWRLSFAFFFPVNRGIGPVQVGAPSNGSSSSLHRQRNRTSRHGGNRERKAQRSLGNNVLGVDDAPHAELLKRVQSINKPAVKDGSFFSSGLATGDSVLPLSAGICWRRVTPVLVSGASPKGGPKKPVINQSVPAYA